jgi:hypothetical protein
MPRTKAKRKAKPLVRRDDVTPERAARNDIASAGMAYRIVPVIDTLHLKGDLTAVEYAALGIYRELAHKAQDDECQVSVLHPRRVMGGGSHSTIVSGPLPSSLWTTPAQLEAAQIERQLGSLADIARAVAVEDKSLTEWCIARHGGREKSANGKVVAIVPRGLDDGKGHIAMARMELRMAAQRIAR